MTVYTIRTETLDGRRALEALPFIDDDAAIAYCLPTARGKALELWRGARIVATVDERPCLSRAA